jgi:hypothetical protein
MTDHERMIEAIKKYLSFGGSAGGISIRRRSRTHDQVYHVGTGKGFVILEEALLAEADRWEIWPTDQRDDTIPLEALRLLRAQLSECQEATRGLRSELREAKSALRPWANLDDKFVAAWGVGALREQARKIVGNHE